VQRSVRSTSKYFCICSTVASVLPTELCNGENPICVSELKCLVLICLITLSTVGLVSHKDQYQVHWSWWRVEDLAKFIIIISSDITSIPMTHSWLRQHQTTMHSPSLIASSAVLSTSVRLKTPAAQSVQDRTDLVLVSCQSREDHYYYSHIASSCQQCKCSTGRIDRGHVRSSAICHLGFSKNKILIVFRFKRVKQELFNHFYAVCPEIYQIRWNNAK